MNKAYVFFIVFCLLGYSNKVVAQNFQWVSGLVSSGYDNSGYSIATDSFGNVYVTGFFSGTTDFDPGSGVFNLICSSANDIFFAKYDSFGNYIWAHNISSTGYDRGYGISVDNLGFVYITGSFNGTADFDPGPGTANLYSSANDLFFAKYDNNGNYLWANNIGGNGDDSGTDIFVNNGSVYLTGYFTGSANFDTGTGNTTLVSAGGSGDIFFAKYDTSGQFIMAAKIGSSGGNDYGASIISDQSGSIYVTGSFIGTTDFDAGTGTAILSGSSTQNIFLLKYDSNGNYIWANAVLNGVGKDIALDGSGNVYITGNFRTTADFDPGTGSSILSALGDDIFLAKYDNNGNYLWAGKVGNTGSDSGNSLVVDVSGNIFLTGFYDGSVDFDFNSGTANIVGVGTRFFLASYNTNGDYLWAYGPTGSSFNYGYCIATDGAGSLFITGSFYATVDFNIQNGGANITSTYGHDVFIAKYSSYPLSVEYSEKINEQLLLWPQPAKNVINIISFKGLFKESEPPILYDFNGRKIEIKVQYVNINEYIIYTSNLDEGVYLLLVDTNKGIIRKKVIIE